ncbi:response regulator transcription factor [Minwuia sp.]|uniref:response regulator transcription factor n=1 Tax=Minwuia sp. TaxID=2493630 RepID=UPI003A8E94EA
MASKGLIFIVDDDDLFRESVGQNLTDEGFTVEEFPDGPEALERLSGGTAPDLILLDWKMPRMNGIEVLKQYRGEGGQVPVIFLTVLSDQIYEEAALIGGAVDFIEKSRSFSILRRRIDLIVGGQRGHVEADGDGPLSLGPLSLDAESARAKWRDREVDLTVAEFAIVHHLASRPGRDCRYRELYDLVRGEGFHAGSGEDGYRTNVRSMIKRIRRKFEDLDPDFGEIDNYPGFGYRWRKPDED